MEGLGLGSGSGSSPKGNGNQHAKRRSESTSPVRNVRPRFDPQPVQYATVQQQALQQLQQLQQLQERPVATQQALEWNQALQQQALQALQALQQQQALQALQEQQALQQLQAQLAQLAQLEQDDVFIEITVKRPPQQRPQQQEIGDDYDIRDLRECPKQDLEKMKSDLLRKQASGKFDANKRNIALIEELLNGEASRKELQEKDSDRNLGKYLLQWQQCLPENYDKNIKRYIDQMIHCIFNDSMNKRYRDKDDVIDRLNKFSPNQLEIMSSFIQNREVFQKCLIREEQIDLIQEVINEKNAN